MHDRSICSGAKIGSASIDVAAELQYTLQALSKQQMIAALST